MKILARKRNWNSEELLIASQYFEVVDSRLDCPNELVIGRYSVIPEYGELERDLSKIGAHLINSKLQHQYIANFDYYEDIKDHTPRTYFSLADIPKDKGPFIIKGRTNSKKHNWNKMYCSNYQDLLPKYFELMEDSMISEQGVVIRDYVPLKTLEKGLNGLNITNEWRLFFYRDQLLSYGYYWSNATTIPDKSSLPSEAIDFAKMIASKVKNNVNFFVIDIAEKESGGWMVVELNDGQQSGLSENDPHELYSNLKKVLLK